jgi:type II secretory pathway pseudopilin PulG
MELRTNQEPNGRINDCRQAGFSVLEMTMGVVLFSIVLASMLGLLEVGRRTRLNTLERNEDLQDVRIALNQMSRDVLNAGVDYPNAGPALPTNWLFNHLGLPASSPTGALDNLMPVIPGNGARMSFAGSAPTNSTLTNTQSNPSTTHVCDQVTLVSANYLFNSTQVATGVTSADPVTLAGTDTISTSSQTAELQVTTPTGNASGGNTVCNVGDIYFVWWAAQPTGVIGIVTSLAKTTASNDSVVLAVSSDPLGLNSFLTSTTDIAKVGNPASAYKLNFVTYYVKDDGSGRGTGTLMRRSYGGSSGGAAIAYTDQPLAFDVSQMTIEYTMSDTTTWTDPATETNPSTGSAWGVSNYANIRQVAVSVTVQSPAKVQLANQAATVAPTPYVAESLTAVMNTRNLGYEKN